VDFIMRHTLREIMAPEEAAEINQSESPTGTLGEGETKVVE